MQIVDGTTPERLLEVGTLFDEYVESLGFDLGFEQIEPYRFNPIPGTSFNELRFS